MIDIHCHILPGLDDGAKDMEEALAMCRVAEADGIKTIVATPHCRNGLYKNSQETILPVLDQLKERVKSTDISLQLLPGADIHLHPEVVPFLKNNPKLLLGGRYFLLELPSQSIPPETRDFFFQVQLAGFVPIITHPERNTVILREPGILEEWVKAGVVVQVTAMSLTGAFGKSIEEGAWHLLRSGLVQVIATDAHSLRRRPPQLFKIKPILRENLGPETDRILLEKNPQRLLEGKELVKLEKIKTNVRPTPFNWKRLFGGRREN